MSLDGKNTGGSFDNNYFMQEGYIKSCSLAYRQANKFDADKVNDITLEVVFTIEKKDGTMYDKTVNIAGNYKRNELDGTVEGWSTAFKIKAFFNTLGMDSWSTDDMGVIPESLCNAVIGKSCWLLSYRSGLGDDEKRIYRTYKLFGKTAEEVEKRFLREVEGKYPPYEYQPKAEEEKAPDTSAPYGASKDDTHPPF